MKELKKK